MARRARGRDLLECAKERLSKAKTAEELRQAQSVDSGLNLPPIPDQTCHFGIAVNKGIGWGVKW